MKSVIAFACLLAVASAGYINSPIVGPAVAYGAYEDGSYRGEGLYESLYKGEGIIESQDLARVAVAGPIIGARAGPVAISAPLVARGSQAVAYNAPLVSAPHPVPVIQTYAAAAPIVAQASRAVAYNAPLVSAPHPVPVIQTYAAAAPTIAQASRAVAYNAPLVSAPHPITVARTYAPIAYAAAAPVFAARTYASPLAYSVAAPAIPLASEARLIDPVAIAAGAPLPTGDTIEVAAAKAAHLQAHAVAKGLAYGVPIGAPGIGLVSEARLVDPVAIAAGAPLPTGDTIEVAAAKAAHYAAHAAAKGHIIAKRSPGLLATSYGTPLVRSYGYPTIGAPISLGYGRLYL